MKRAQEDSQRVGTSPHGAVFGPRCRPTRQRLGLGLSISGGTDMQKHSTLRVLYVPCKVQTWMKDRTESNLMVILQLSTPNARRRLMISNSFSANELPAGRREPTKAGAWQMDGSQMPWTMWYASIPCGTILCSEGAL